LKKSEDEFNTNMCHKPHNVNIKNPSLKNPDATHAQQKKHTTFKFWELQFNNSMLWLSQKFDY